MSSADNKQTNNQGTLLSKLTEALGISTGVRPAKTAIIPKPVLVVVLTLILLTTGYYGYLYMRDARSNLLSGHYKIAYQQFISKAEQGEPAAQNVIGNLYFLGLGVKRDQSLAARWYLKAALQGYVAAQLNLGQSYWNGQGLPARPLKALGWFVLARNSGSQRADGHIKYMIQANSILPNMIEAAKRDYKELALVNERYLTLGENDFLLK